MLRKRRYNAVNIRGIHPEAIFDNVNSRDS